MLINQLVIDQTALSDKQSLLLVWRRGWDLCINYFMLIFNNANSKAASPRRNGQKDKIYETRYVGNLQALQIS